MLGLFFCNEAEGSLLIGDRAESTLPLQKKRITFL